ncbi:MAG: fatty acid desaturase [Candidatus Sericytochromatia bacterium]
MDESFHESWQISGAELKDLMVRSDAPALRRFATQYALLLGAAAVIVAGPELGWPLWVRLLAGGIFALMVLPMFAVVHESGHYTAFRSRWLDKLVLWLAGVPMFYTPTGFREFHFAHHRHTHDPLRDPEISIGGRAAPSLTAALPNYLLFYSGFPLMFFKFVLVAAAAIGTESIWKNLLVYVTPRARKRVCWEARGTMLLYIAWGVAGVLWLPGLLQLLLAALLGHSLLMTCLIGEHNGLPHEGDILIRTRTTLTHPLVRWLMWNMPYHAEHHAYPAVPWHALPRLHALLKPELQNLEPGYRNFHRRVLASLVQGRPFQADPGSKPVEEPTLV